MAVLQATTITGGLTMHGMAAGFVKLNAEGAVVMDTATYATTASLSSYLPLSGGTLTGQLTITGARLLLQTGGVNTYGVVSGYNNNNHLMTMRGAISGSTDSPTITGAHQMTFVEYADAGDTSGWYFKSSNTGTYEEIAKITRTGIKWSGNLVLHAGNYNSYSPTLTGGGASGTWGINISGNAATVTNGVYTTGDQSIGGRKTFTGNIRMSSAMGFDAGQVLYFGYEEGFGGSDTGGLDYGYITYDNNNSTYGTAGGETSTLRIGTQNDGDGSVGDHVAIESAANIYLRPGAWGGGGSVRVGTLGSFSTVWHSGNLTNLNQLSNGPGYVTGGPYLPLAGGTMIGNVQFNANLLQFNNSGVRSWNMGISGGNLNIYSGDGSGSLLYNGRPLRDSYYRTFSGFSDYYTGGTAGWYRVAEITLTSNCSGAVIFGTLYDNRYDGADAYQISVVARSECDFSSNNESHYINVGCTILGSTNYSNYRDKIRVVLSASSTNSRTYELQFYETPWNHDTWQIESTGWTVYTSPQAPRAAVGTPRVNYISKQNADNLLANAAVYSPVYYDIANSSYYLDLNSTTSLRTVGSWRSDSGAWDGEFSGKIQYHSNHWYFQAADLWLFRNAGGSNVFSVNQSGSGTFNGTVSASNISTGVTASHIVQRDANGYIYANHINFNTPESENPAISSFFTSNGDGWSRKSSIAHVRNQLGNYGNWITASSLSSYLPLSGGTMTGNLYIQSGANPTQFNLRGTNPELYVDASFGGGTARLFINRASSGNQAALHFSTGTTVTNGSAWNFSGTPLWTLGMTNSSQTSDFKIAYGDIYDAVSVAIRIDTGLTAYFTNTPYVGGNAIATQSWVTSQGYLTSGSGFATRQDGARYTTDFNSILSSGFFNAEASPANAPNSYGQLIVAKGIDTGLQIAGGYSSQQLWFRGWGYGPEAGGFYPWRRLLNNGADPYAADMNQYVKTTSSPTFSSNLYISADGSSGYVASRIWLYSHNNYRGAGIYMSGTGSTWFAGTGYTDFDGAYIISRRSVAGDDSTAWNNYRVWQVGSGGSTYQTGDVSASSVHAYAATGRVVAGSWNFDGMLFDSSRSALIARGNYPHLELWSDVSNNNHGPTIRFGGYDNGSSGAYKSWNIGTAGSNLLFLDIGYGGNNSNPHAGIAGLGAAYSYPGAITIMRFYSDGNVGIGNFGTYGSEGASPSFKLDVRGTGRFTGALSANTTLTVGSGGDALAIAGAEGRITFRDQALTWTGYVGFRGNLGVVEFPGRNVQISSGYNGYVEVNTGTNDYLSGRLTVPFGSVNARRGFTSDDNPWGTSNSSYHPNGITTAGGTNWIYGHTYLGNAPSNGSGGEVSSVGRIYIRNGNTSGTWGYAGYFVDRNSAANNYVPWSFENEYGNHSWGLVARFHIQQSGADRPSIQFSSMSSNTRWSVGYVSSDDNFRITQNHGMRPDNSGNDGWGTERFRINTDGATHLALGNNATVYIARHIDARDTWGSCGCVTAFLGWNGSKIMLGNGNSGGHDYGNARGGNTIVSNNPHYFYSNIEANSSIRFQEADDRRLYGASLGAGYNAVRVQGNWSTFDIMGRVLDWTGSNMHFGNGYNGEDHSAYYFVLGNPVSYFQVNGPIYATGDVVAYYSDRRLKQNIEPIDSALGIIDKIGAYTFEWNKKSEEVWAKKEGDKDFGLISQEVEAVWPMGVAVQSGKDINDKYGYGDPNSEYYDPLHVEKNPEEYKTVRYDKMVTLAIAAIKEQQLLIESQQKQIDELKEQLKNR